MSDESTSCPCGSGRTLMACCSPLLNQDKRADTAEQLMRARFIAYVLGEKDFLLASWDSTTRPKRKELDIEETPVWKTLQVIHCEGGGRDNDRGVVEFIAHGQLAGQTITLHETSRFMRLNGQWLYIDGDIHPDALPPRKIARNAPCPCGSGKKHKRCCGA